MSHRPAGTVRAAAHVRRRSFELAVLVVILVSPVTIVLAATGLGASRGPITDMATGLLSVGLAGSLLASRRGAPLDRLMARTWTFGFGLLVVMAVESPLVLGQAGLDAVLADIVMVGLVLGASAYLTLPLRWARLGAAASFVAASSSFAIAGVWRGGATAEAATLLLAGVVVVLTDVNGRVAATVAREEERSRVQALLADVDVLTDLRNRRGMTAAVDAMWPVGVLMVDLDHFKQINDEHGHEVGDETLRVVGRALQAAVREDDVVGRWGGEEFLVLTSAAVPSTLGERLRRAVAASATPVPVTASIGVAVPLDADAGFEHTLRRADAALYRAKAAGRDVVTIAGPGDG